MENCCTKLSLPCLINSKPRRRVSRHISSLQHTSRRSSNRWLDSTPFHTELAFKESGVPLVDGADQEIGDETGAGGRLGLFEVQVVATIENYNYSKMGERVWSV